MLSLNTHIVWNVLSLFAGLVLMYSGFWLLKIKKVRKQGLKNIAVFNFIIGLAIVIVDIIFLSKFFGGEFMSKGSHIFWETMGVISGAFLINTGLYILFYNKQKSLRKVAFLNIGLGIINILVDGFLFLSSWK